MRTLISSFAALAGLGGIATAADLGRPVAPAPFVAAPYSWTGFYAGLNAGYGWGQNTAPAIVLTDPGSAIGLAGIVAAGGFVVPNPSPQGFIGGGQIGYDQQWGMWVGGIVADFQGAQIKDSVSSLVSPAGPATSTSMSLSHELEFLGTLRGKLGVASGNWLFYGTGGFAYGQVKTSFNATANFAGGTTVAMAGSASEWSTGWTAGAGINYGMGSWIFGLEYLRYDLGTASVTATQTVNTFGGGPASGTASQTTAGNIVRATASYRF